MFRTLPLLALLVALLLFPTSAAAAGGGSLAINPSYLDVEVERGSELPAITISNGTDKTVDVHVQPLPATQQLDGLPSYEFTPEQRRIGNEWFKVSPAEFTLKPGQEQEVHAQVNVCSQDGLGTYAVLAFESSLAGAGADPDQGAVESVIRLATTMLLSYPGACIDGELEALRAEQAREKVLSFTATAANTGNLHAKPQSLELEIFDGDELVYSRMLQRENVIPNASREFTAELSKKQLPAGSYTAIATMRFGGSLSTAKTSFKLSGANTLPTPDPKILAFDPPEAEPDEPFTADATLVNRGTATAEGTIVFSLYRDGAGAPLVEEELALEELAAGEERSYGVDLPALERGTYRLEAEIISDERSLDVRSVSFIVEEGPSLFTKIANWLAAHVLWVVAALLVLAIAIAVGAVVYVRRRLG